MKEAVKTITRSETPLEINLEGDEHISATPNHLYYPLEAIRAEGCTVIEATTDDVDAPIFLIEEPEADTKLAKAAQAVGTLKHVSIVSGGHAAEVVWHPVVNKAAEDKAAEGKAAEGKAAEAKAAEGKAAEGKAAEAKAAEGKAAEKPVSAKKTTAKKVAS